MLTLGERLLEKSWESCSPSWGLSSPSKSEMKTGLFLGAAFSAVGGLGDLLRRESEEVELRRVVVVVGFVVGFDVDVCGEARRSSGVWLLEGSR